MTDIPPAGPAPENSIDVRDPRALRALAHPLRGTLLGLLRLEGPSTATRLGQRLGESSGATSYHLRQLATFGFVEEVVGEGTGRERWWRALHRSTRWETQNFLAEPGGREVVEELSHRQLSQQSRLLAAHAEQREDLDDDWRTAVSLNDWFIHLSAAGARQLGEELNAVLMRWRGEGRARRADGARPARPVPADRLSAVKPSVNKLTAVSARRRFVLLTALRWLPLGISIPVTVLLASSRGLSPADIGLVFVAHSVVPLPVRAARMRHGAAGVGRPTPVRTVCGI